MNRSRRWVTAVAVFAVLAIVLAACGSDNNKSSKSTRRELDLVGGPVPTGGTLVVGAEQEPDCAFWIGELRRRELGPLHDPGAHDAPHLRLREEERVVGRDAERPARR